jgi:hypothetical protein
VRLKACLGLPLVPDSPGRESEVDGLPLVPDSLGRESEVDLLPWLATSS